MVAVNTRLLRYLTFVLSCPLACSSSAPATSVATDGGAPGPAISIAPIAPGFYVVDPATPGGGACAATTLGDALSAIRAAQPDLAAVTTIYNPTQQGTSDGSFIYPYQTGDGGFAIAFKRGDGDCPAGCIENTYDYFRTDDACIARAIGHFHQVSGTCLQIDGTPMWGHPLPPPDPSIVCGADNTPQDIGGKFTFRARGQSRPCAISGDRNSANDVDATVTVTVIQGGANPGAGVVIITGSGNPLVDGVGLAAAFIRRRFEATLQKSNLPSNCPQESVVTARYDFESGAPGTVTATQTGDTNCSMCKGDLTLALTAALTAADDKN